MKRVLLAAHGKFQALPSRLPLLLEPVMARDNPFARVELDELGERGSQWRCKKIARG
jgi:hypothetical protein